MNEIILFSKVRLYQTIQTHYDDFLGYEEFLWKLKEDINEIKTQIAQIETKIKENQVR
jgi:hypothetical protein